MKNYLSIKKVGISLLLCSMFLLMNNAKAQVFKGFVSLGGNISQIDGDEVYGFKKVAFTGGIGAMMPFNVDKPNDGFQFSMEINYSRRGAKQSTWGDPFIYNATLDYADIPFLLHWADKKGGITLGAGIQYGRLVHYSESWVLPDTMIRGNDRPTTTKASFLKNDWAVIGDLRFTLWQKFKLDIRYQYSLTPIRKGFEFNNSYAVDDDVNYRTWKRDYKNNWVTVKLIYVINEEQEQKIVPKRKTAY
ncbi:MAG: PorT family protein [Bacteroidales bacterium]|nr:PorT family protein [Bacteroidales bacterium]